MLPCGWKPAAVQGQGYRAASSLLCCVDWGWPGLLVLLLGHHSHPSEPLCAAAAELLDCRRDAKALDALGGP